MSLDDKLREILRDEALGNYTKDLAGDYIPLDWSATPNSYYEQAVAQIKQVFADEVTPKTDAILKQMQEVLTQSQEQLGKLKTTKAYIYTDKSQSEAEGLMSGQEWYKRFIQEVEYDDSLNGKSFMLTRDKFLELAKRASGIQ